MTFVALVLSFSTHVTARLLASLTAFLAAFLTFVAFLCDIALYGWVKHQVGKLSNVGSNTDTAPGESRLPRASSAFPHPGVGADVNADLEVCMDVSERLTRTMRGQGSGSRSCASCC